MIDYCAAMQVTLVAGTKPMVVIASEVLVTLAIGRGVSLCAIKIELQVLLAGTTIGASFDELLMMTRCW